MKRILALSLGLALSVGSQAAFAQATSKSGVPPTAEGAAAQVGKSPASAKTKTGKRVEPSQKLWNNPRTVSEQPGTTPPPNQGTVTSPKSSTSVEKQQPTENER
ncbi:hypothetical protein [Acetobacter conturbans]|uniref:Uncharacterized protein n=1 Tax=Acetobacter conturbans TaxID=1737472 RepID=A0ABX0JX32_9PROT|nr:hypothetical protein [Acetobacter conturbans]NHN87394.1 hypothetical protein [Acetobacter conturbans]